MSDKSHSAQRTSRENLAIPEGNWVLLFDYSEGQSKIQDKYKSEEFVVVGNHPDPNVCNIMPEVGKGLVQTVN